VKLGPAPASVGVETSAVCSPGRGDAAPGVVRTIVAAGMTCTVDAGGGVACSGIPARDGVEIDTARLHPLPGVLGAVDAVVDPYEWCVAAASGAWTCWPRLREHVPSAPVASDASTGTSPVVDAAPPRAAVPGIASATALVQNRFAFCHSDADGHTRCLSRHRGGPDEELVLSGVRKLAVGIGHACAIDDHDRLSCWGANESGQASGGKGTARVDAPVAVMGDVVDVGVGLGHTCAVKRDGSVVCFGDNRSGQLGNGSIAPAGAPAAVAGLPEPALHVAVAFDHTCVSTAQGHVLCWGVDTKDAEPPSTAALRPHPVEGLSLPVKDIAAGGDRTCALLANASVTCWGRGTWQEPGEDGAPRAVAGTDASVELGMGDNHACVRNAGGHVRCWGWNQQGQLGATLTTRRIGTGPPGGCPIAVYTTDQHAQGAVDVEW
jgi:alpha-tubulin suppressor-like RCC1 family protein